MGGAIALLLCAPLACGSLLGIDDGKPRGDASTIVEGLPDVAIIDPPADGGADCTPDLDWCDTHCGTGPDNCGQTRNCSADCPTGESCLSNVCKCQQDLTWCTGRCDKTTDNCGTGIDCGDCEAGVECFSGFCGCMPDPLATTCAGRQCGQATNNCGLPVNCGVNHTTDCATGDYCEPVKDTCCTPDNSACAGKCMTSITNTCGVTEPCPDTCPGNQPCVSHVCCTPDGCSAPCIDSCGQPNNACCVPDAGKPPLDAGSPPPVDAGGCAGVGAPCASGCCNGLLCGQYDTCVSSCQKLGSSCSTAANDCCFGLSCSAGVMPATVDSVEPDLIISDATIGLSGTCQ
jgi:hypothetical protein